MKKMFLRNFWIDFDVTFPFNNYIGFSVKFYSDLGQMNL